MAEQTEWECVAAGALGDFKGGSGFPTRYQGDATGKYPFYKVSDMNLPGNEKIMYSANNYISENVRGLLAAAVFPQSSIVFAKVGAAVFLERKRLLSKPSCLDNNMAAFIVDPARLNPRYAHHALTHFRLGSLVSVGALPSLNGTQLRSIPFMLPPTRQEQNKVADVLDEADALIEALDRLGAKKRDVKQGMMQDLLTGRTRLPGFTGEWNEIELGQLGGFLKGRGIKRDQVRSSGIPCIRYGELYTTFRSYARKTVSFVDPDVAMMALPIKSGDLLFAGSGETKAEIGMTVAYVGEAAAVAGGDIIVLRGNGFDPIFVGSLLNTPSLAVQKASRGQGDAVVHIGASALAGLRLRLPAIDEQRAIAKILQDADAEVAALERRLESARALKVGMMQEMLTGRTRLRMMEEA